MSDAKYHRPAWVSALTDTALSSIERVVLAYLVWRQGRNGSAWPSQRTIAQDLGLTCDGVRKITQRLESKGRLTIERPAHTAPGRLLRYQVVKSQITQTTVGANTPTAIGVKRQNHPDGCLGCTPTAVGANTPTAVSRNYTGKKTRTLQARETRAAQEGNGELFDRFWGCYPKKVAKEPARKAWAKLRPDTTLAKRIIAAVEQYAGTDGWQRDGGRYVPNPTTFLNQRRWEDDIPPSALEAALGTKPCTEAEGIALYKELGLWEGDKL